MWATPASSSSVSHIDQSNLIGTMDSLESCPAVACAMVAKATSFSGIVSGFRFLSTPLGISSCRRSRLK